MNQGKIWRVVSPTIGVPVYLGAVVVTALILHGALILKADWYGAYWNGASLKGKAVAMAPAATPVTTAAAPTK